MNKMISEYDIIEYIGISRRFLYEKKITQVDFDRIVVQLKVKPINKNTYEFESGAEVTYPELTYEIE